MKRSLLLFGLLLTSLFLQGQGDHYITGKSIRELKNIAYKGPQIGLPSYSFTSLRIEKPIPLPYHISLKQQLLQPYDVEDLAFFCRLEVKIEKKLKIPFKFRLGEVQYTERMEGKY